MGDRHRALTRRGSRAALVAGVWLAFAPAPIAAAVRADAGPRLVWRIAEDARGIPAHDGQSVYFLSQRHELVAASVTSGRVRWRVPMDSTGFTFGSRVIVRGDVVVAGDYDLVGVDRRTGRQRWTLSPSDGGGAGVHLGGVSGGVAYSGSLAGSLHAIDLDTGRLRWSVPVGDPSSTTVYAPVVAGAMVAASFSGFGETPAGGVIVADARTGAVRWQRVLPGSVGASGNPVFAGRAVLAAARDGTIHALDVTNGRSLWTWPKVERLRDEQDYRPLAVHGRIVLAGSLSGEIVAHDVLTRKVLWKRTPVAASVAFGMAAEQGVLFVPYLSNHLVALRVSDGAELWRIGGSSDSQFRWVPLVDGPLLFVSGSQAFAMFRHDGAYVRRRR